MKIYYRFLDFNKQERPDAKQKREHKAVKNGPMGTLDTYQQAYAVDGESAWYVASVKRAKKPKTIIFANPVLTRQPLSGYEHELLDALVQHHDVYLWQGSHIQLVSYEPVTSSASLRDESYKVIEQEDAIRRSLIKQGLDIRDFIIIDTKKYYDMMTSIIADELNFHAIDTQLRVIPEDSKHLFTIYSMILEADSKKDTDLAVAIESKPATSKKSITCKISTEEDKITVTHETTSLILEDHVNTVVDLSKYKSLKYVTVKNSDIAYVELPESVVSLTLINCSGIKFLDLHKLQELQSIRVLNCTSLSKVKANKQLTHLQLRNCYSLVAVNLVDVEYLHTLEVTNPKNEFEFTHYDSLKTIDHVCLINLDNAKVTQEFLGKIERNYSLDLRTVSLETLSLNYRFHNAYINDCRALMQIDASESDTLHALEVTSCQPALQCRVKETCKNVSINEKDKDKNEVVRVNNKTPVLANSDLSKRTNIEILHLDNLTMHDVSFYPTTLKRIFIFGGQTSGKILDLSRFTQLESIYLGSVKHVSIIKSIPGTVKKITISECPDLRGIDFSNITELDELTLSNLGEYNLINFNLTKASLLSVEGKLDRTFSLVDKLETLACERLHLYKSNVGIIGKLPKTLVELRLSECNEIMAFSLKMCPMLRSLEVRNCAKLARIETSKCKVNNLVLRDNPELEPQQLVLWQTSLKSAEIERNNYAREMLGINLRMRLPTAGEVKVFHRDKLESIRATNKNQRGVFHEEHTNEVVKSGLPKVNLDSITTLVLDSRLMEGCSTVPDLSKFKNLSALILRYMIVPDIKSLPPKLSHLKLENCLLTSPVIDFSGHENLSIISLSQMQRLKEVKGLNDLSTLTVMDCGTLNVNLSGCKSLFGIYCISSAQRQELTISGKETSIGLIHFENQVTPNTLEQCMNGADRIGTLSLKMIQHDFKFPRHTARIESLQLDNCDKITAVVLMPFTSLVELVVRNCFNLERLSCMPYSLTTVRATRNAKLQLEVCRLDKLETLEAYANNFIYDLKDKHSDVPKDRLVEYSAAFANMIAKSPTVTIDRPKSHVVHCTGDTEQHSEVLMPDLTKVNTDEVEVLYLKNLNGVDVNLLPSKLSFLKVTNCKFKNHDLNLIKSRIDCLALENCKHIDEISASEHIENISINNCHGIKTLGLSNITTLVSLTLECVNSKLRFSGQRNLKEIKTLEINGDIPGSILELLASGVVINKLSIFSASNIDKLAIPDGLQILKLRACSGLRLLDLSECSTLNELNIQYCSKLTDIVFPHFEMNQLTIVNNEQLIIKDLLEKIPQPEKYKTLKVTNNHPEMDSIDTSLLEFCSGDNDNRGALERFASYKVRETAVINIAHTYTPDRPDAPISESSNAKTASSSSPTKGPTIRKAGCIVTVFDKSDTLSLEKNYYRFNTFNQVCFDETSQHLAFVKNLNGMTQVFKPVILPHQNEKTLLLLNTMVINDANIACGNMVVLLGDDTELPVVTTPITNPEKDIVFYCNQADSLDFIYDKINQKIYIKLKEFLTDPVKIELSYHFTKHGEYLTRSIQPDMQPLVSSQPLLDKPLHALVKQLIDSEPRLHFMHNNDFSLAEKLDYLRCYCKGFNDEAIKDDGTPSTFKILCDIIIKRRGVCRHRAEAYMLLAHYLNVVTNMQTNGIHAFIELPIIVGPDQHRVLGLCLGGRDVLELMPADERNVDPYLSVQKLIAAKVVRKPVASAVPQPSQPKVEPVKVEPAIVEPPKVEAPKVEAPKVEAPKVEAPKVEAPKVEAPKVEAPKIEAPKPVEVKPEIVATESPKAAEVAVEEPKPAEVKPAEAPKPVETPKPDPMLLEVVATKKQLEESKKELFPPVATLSSVVALLDDSGPHSPLFKLTSEMKPLLVNQAILQELKYFKRDDLLAQHLYIHSPADINRYLDTKVITDGEARIIRGRLHTLLEQGGLLVINWDTFSDTQKLSLMCMLEHDGTLRGNRVTAKLHIVSLLHMQANAACEAFLTRTTLFNLSQDYCSKWSKPLSSNNNNHVVEIDLFGLPNWQERLLGEVANQGKGLELLDNGALIQALRDGFNLTIYNPPAQPAFETFIDRVLTERKFLHNGEIIQVSDNFNVKISSKNNPLQLDNVKVLRAPVENAKPGIFIHANNLQQCYKRRVVDQTTQQAFTQPGWLCIENDFYITDFISCGEWQELLTHVANFKDRQFTFTLLAGAEIEGVATSMASSKRDTLSHMVYTNDHDYCANQLAEFFGDAADIIDVTPDTTYDKLIAVAKDKRNDKGQIQSSYSTRLLADALTSGRIVILNGPINPDLYQMLLPYLYPELSVLYHNDTKAVCTGQLYCIMPLANRNEFDTIDYHVAHFGLEDYRELLPADQVDDIGKLERLVSSAKALPHHGIGHPASAPELTFQRYQYNLARILKREAMPHASNPTKGTLLASYPQNSSAYKHLNQLAKELLDRDDAFEMKPVNEHKPFQQFEQLKADNGTKVIFLKGTHGTSKSYSLRAFETTLPSGQFFKGIKDIKAWLEAKPIDPTKRLPIAFDEVNMYAPGFFDILKGIFRGVVVYHGKKYTVTPNHMVLATGNFESYPNRYFHPFFEQYAETLIFTMPPDQWLQKYFIQPMLNELNISGEDAALVSEKLLWVFNHITDYRPLLELSLRDMKSLVQRFALLYTSGQDINSALQKTCVNEFISGFDDAKQRQRFLSDMNYVSVVDCDVRKLRDLYIPSEKFELIDIIQEDLALCEYAVANNKPYRYGVLLEGPSGVGKSSFYKAILESKGYSRQSADPAKRYYTVTVDNSSSAALNLLKAYFNGSKIILDEINLNPEIEALLNDLLEGVLPTDPIYADLIREAAQECIQSRLDELLSGMLPTDEGYDDLVRQISQEIPEPNPGFFVLATQNPATMIGRGVSSLALLNRFHCLLMDNYSDVELFKILRAAHIRDAEHVLQEFNAARKRDPEFYNARKLFEWIREQAGLVIDEEDDVVIPVEPVIFPEPVEPVVIPEPVEPVVIPEPVAPPLPPKPAPVAPPFIWPADEPAPSVAPAVAPEPMIEVPAPAPAQEPSKSRTALKWILVGVIALAVAALAVGIAIASGGTAVPLLIGVGVGALVLAGGVGAIIAKFGLKTKQPVQPAAPIVEEPITAAPRSSVVLTKNPAPLFSRCTHKRKAPNQPSTLRLEN